jgi:hypothetical protein
MPSPISQGLITIHHSPSFRFFVFHSFIHSFHYHSQIILSYIMDHNQLNPAEMAQLQSYIARMQSQPPPPVSAPNIIMQAPSALPQSIPPSTTPMLQSQLPSSVPAPNRIMQALPQSIPSSTTPISRPYESQRATRLPSAPLGHPSVPAGSQPFLGFNSLGVSTSGQVNQERLASSARYRGLPVRGRRNGRSAAVHPPSVSRTPRLNDCIVNVVDANGFTTQGLRMKIKVYPPLVSIGIPLTYLIITNICLILNVAVTGGPGHRISVSTTIIYRLA